MTRREAERQTRQADTLRGLGFTREEREQLRRISMTLRRWFEQECNGTIQRDDTTDKPYAVYGMNHEHRSPVADRETGARRRLDKIVKARNERTIRQTSCVHCALDIEGCYPFTAGYWRDRGNNTTCGNASVHEPADALPLVSAYIQTDPRGAALYLIRPGDVPEGQDVSAYYTRGICVY